MKARGVERENETDEGEGRTDQEARVRPLDWVWPAVTSFRWQVLHNSSNHRKTPHQHLTSHEKQEEKLEIERSNTFSKPSTCKEKRTLVVRLLMNLVSKKKKAQEPFSHLLNVSVWERLSLNGFPPVPHICTRTAKSRLQFVQADKAEKSGTAQSPSERNKTRLWFSF